MAVYMPKVSRDLKCTIYLELSFFCHEPLRKRQEHKHILMLSFLLHLSLQYSAIKPCKVA